MAIKKRSSREIFRMPVLTNARASNSVTKEGDEYEKEEKNDGASYVRYISEQHMFAKRYPPKDLPETLRQVVSYCAASLKPHFPRLIPVDAIVEFAWIQFQGIVDAGLIFPCFIYGRYVRILCFKFVFSNFPFCKVAYFLSQVG